MSAASRRISFLGSGLLLAACTAAEPTASSSDLAAAPPTPACTDVPPDATYTCGEQVGWGKCDEPWMEGACDRSCGRCPGIGSPEVGAVACDDVPPGSSHTCAEQASWGKCDEPWMEGFCRASCDRCELGATLIDPDASANARALMSYLVSAHGDEVLAGQQGRAEAEHMAALTGRYPALLGLDLMDYSPSRVEHGATSDSTEQALDWSETRGGLVTISWHWNAPTGLVDSTQWPWWKGFYTQATTFDLAKAMNDRGSVERQLLLRDIDAIAAQLQRLEDAGVPVLWRPLHEASAGWFWWGAHGPAPYLALWRLLYDRLVNEHGLHNLIWVWNGQAAEWYPGDQYVDVVAEDIYDRARDYDPQESAYLRARDYAGGNKLVALSETGTLPDPAELLESRARWSWFMLWSGDFANTEKWNEDAMKREVYASDLVTTLDELPDLQVE
jgi:mannan endo-1,4-beta-mannosidase